jgi:hypothetical protein
MANRGSWASRFWLLLCAASLLGSLLTWGGRHAAQRPYGANAAAVPPEEPPSIPRPAPAISEPLAAAPATSESPSTAAAALPSPRTVLADPSPAPQVRRCVVRGRVSYVDAAAMCSDGSAGRITVLPR